MDSTTDAFPQLPQPTSAYRDPVERGADVLAFDARELRAIARNPGRVIDLVLVERARLGKTIASGDHLLELTAILLAVSILSALPYGAVLGVSRAFRVAALNVGSVAICFPALHVFGAYFGCRSRARQTLGLALIVSAVAGLFTLSFAPILWFIRVTTAPGSIVVSGVSTCLLGFSMLVGVVHLARTVDARAAHSPDRPPRLLMAMWMALLLVVAVRMAEFLDLV